jgi:hypothetical protein
MHVSMVLLFLLLLHAVVDDEFVNAPSSLHTHGSIHDTYILNE